MKICKSASSVAFFPVASLFFVLQLQLMNQATAFVIAPSPVGAMSSRMPSQRFVSTIFSDFSAPRSPFSRDNNNKDDCDHDEGRILEMNVVAEVPMTTLNNIIMTTGIATSDQRLLINQMDIPIKRERTANEIHSAQYLIAMEMTVGRIAMLVAALFMATELSTGMSFPQQLAKILPF